MNVIEKLYHKIEDNNLWDGKVSLKRNEFLKAVGTIDTSLYYIVSGSVKMSVISKHKEHVIRFGYKDNFMAALDSFISENPSDFCIQAIKKTELKFISKATHLSLINQDANNQLLWMKILEQMVYNNWKGKKTY